MKNTKPDRLNRCESESQVSAKKNITPLQDNNDKLSQLLGVEYKGYIGQAAVKKLLDEKQGHIKDAFYNEKVGYIALYYGDEKSGLLHIMNERRNRNLSPHKFITHLGETVINGTAFPNEKDPINKVNLAYKSRVVVITYNLQNTDTTAILTAFLTQ